MKQFFNTTLTIFISLIIGILTYFLSLAGTFFNLAISAFLFFGGILSFFIGQGSFLMVAVGYIISPFGLPLIADFLITKLTSFNDKLKSYNN